MINQIKQAELVGRFGIGLFEISAWERWERNREGEMEREKGRGKLK